LFVLFSLLYLRIPVGIFFYFLGLHIRWLKLLKGVSKRDVTGVEIRLKNLTSYNTGNISFWHLKERHHERSIKPVSA
jgi:hypothetical protein